MPAELHRFLSDDHERLDKLLRAALRDDGSIDQESYASFRKGILRHIAIEEKVLMPEVRRRKGSTPLEQQLHRDHAAISALLVPPPSADEIEQIRTILHHHNNLEEDDGGFYDIVEQLSGPELSELMTRVHAVPEVPVAPHVDSPTVRRSIEQLVRESEEGLRQLML